MNLAIHRILVMLDNLRQLQVENPIFFSHFLRAVGFCKQGVEVEQTDTVNFL